MKNPHHASLHEKAIQLANHFRNAQAALIDVLQEIDREKVYFEVGCSSLHDYARTYLKLSDDVAWTLIKIARLSVEVPTLKFEIQKGEITTSNARLIAPVLEKVLQTERTENQRNEAVSELLRDAKNLSKRELERKVVAQNPELSVRESVRFVASERLKLTVGVSEEILEDLKRVQDLESQRLGRAVSLEEAIRSTAKAYLYKNDPLEKAKRSQERARKIEIKNAHSCRETHSENRATSPIPTNPNEMIKSTAPVRRTALPAAIRHEVRLKNHSQCAQIDFRTGKRCTSRRWLDIHHKKPISGGGTNGVENLTLLCKGHHRAMHVLIERGHEQKLTWSIANRGAETHKLWNLKSETRRYSRDPSIHTR